MTRPLKTNSVSDVQGRFGPALLPGNNLIKMGPKSKMFYTQTAQFSVNVKRSSFLDQFQTFDVDYK